MSFNKKLKKLSAAHNTVVSEIVYEIIDCIPRQLTHDSVVYL